MSTQERTYDPQDIRQRLASELPDWEYRDGWIRRRYKTGGWPYTLMAVNAIGYIAEASFHHPDLSVSWAHVDVKLMTHSAKGITDKDFALARLIEQHVPWLPKDDSPLAGFEAGMKKKWVR